MGTLHVEQRRILVDHLRKATTTSDLCWFAMWDGFGGIDDGGVRERVELPNRNYLLYGGTIDRALETLVDPFPFDQSPNLWCQRIALGSWRPRSTSIRRSSAETTPSSRCSLLIGA
jgi:hypothetical protein